MEQANCISGSPQPLPSWHRLRGELGVKATPPGWAAWLEPHGPALRGRGLSREEREGGETASEGQARPCRGMSAEPGGLLKTVPLETAGGEGICFMQT